MHMRRTAHGLHLEPPSLLPQCVPIWPPRHREAPAPTKKRASSAPRRNYLKPTAAANARSASAPARARPTTVRASRPPPPPREPPGGHRHERAAVREAQDAALKRQAQEIAKLRRSLKVLTAERDELKLFKEGVEKERRAGDAQLRQREAQQKRKWHAEKDKLAARLRDCEAGFEEQVRELRQEALEAAALRQTAEQLAEQLAAAEAETAAARTAHTERMGACEEALQLALSTGQRHAAGMAEARAAEQAWRARHAAAQHEMAAMRAELEVVAHSTAQAHEGVKAVVERGGRQLAAAQARELELERALQLALSAARGAARRGEVERRLVAAEVAGLEQTCHALLSQGARAAHLVAVHEHSLELSKEEAALRSGVVGALEHALALAPTRAGLAAQAHCMDTRTMQLTHAMGAMAQESGGVEARREALLASQRHVQQHMREALSACRAEEAERRGVERPLRPPEEVLWGELVSNVTGLTSTLREAIAANQ